MQASKLDKIVIHQKTCSEENKQDTVPENNRKVRDLFHREDDQRSISRALISRGLGRPVLTAPLGEDPQRGTGGNWHRWMAMASCNSNGGPQHQSSGLTMLHGLSTKEILHHLVNK